MYVTQDGFRNTLFSGHISVPATTHGVNLVTALATAGYTVPPNAVVGVKITNNDASATIYVAYDNNVASTYFFKALAPSAPFFEDIVKAQALGSIYLISSSGTVNVYVGLLG